MFRLAMKIFFEQLKKYELMFAELGYLAGLLYAANRGFNRVFGKDALWCYILFAQPVVQDDRLPMSRGRAIVVRTLDSNDPALACLPTPPQVIAYRFRQGAVCLGAFKDSEIIGCAWLRLGAFDEDEVRCYFVPLPPDQTAWDFDVYVAPAQRGTLAFLRLWDSANAYLRERGVKWSMSRISAFNRMSLVSHIKMGACRLGSATYLRIGDWQIMFSTLKPFLHISLGPVSKPRLDLHAPTMHG